MSCVLAVSELSGDQHRLDVLGEFVEPAGVVQAPVGEGSDETPESDVGGVDEDRPVAGGRLVESDTPEGLFEVAHALFGDLAHHRFDTRVRTFETRYFGQEKTDVAVVPSPETPYRARTTTLFPDCCFVHNHDFMFFHDGPSGTTAFLQHLNQMIDSSCGYQLHGVVNQMHPECGGELETRPGTPVADLFGGGASSHKTSMAFNHPDSHAWGYISLRDVANPD